jgi:hypothetical protein
MINLENEKGRSDAYRLNPCQLEGKGKPFKGGVNSPLIQVFFKLKIKSDENIILFSGWAYRFFLSP